LRGEEDGLLPTQLKNAGWGGLHAARFSTIEEAPAVPVNGHMIRMATLVEVAVRIAPAAYLMPRTSVLVRFC